MGQWLEIRGLEQTPNVDKALLASMRGETEHFFKYIVANDRPITDMLFADYSFVDEKLARLYGIPSITGAEFQKVQLDPGQTRRHHHPGLVPDPDVKALEDDGFRTSPVVRGKFILENLFNQKIPPPPPNVPALALDTNKQLVGTVRQIFEQHRENPTCAGCPCPHGPLRLRAGELLRHSANGATGTTTSRSTPRARSMAEKFTTPAEFRKVLRTRKGDFRRGRGPQDPVLCAGPRHPGL